jgi:hypothetical protein
MRPNFLDVDFVVLLFQGRWSNRRAEHSFRGGTRHDQISVRRVYREWYAEQPQNASLRFWSVSTSDLLEINRRQNDGRQGRGGRFCHDENSIAPHCPTLTGQKVQRLHDAPDA